MDRDEWRRRHPVCRHAQEGLSSNLHSSRDGAFSSAFFDLDVATTCRTDSSSSALDDADASGEDVYEMALEVLEGDEAYRLESSGSISPESDVDRLLENADAERFPGDVTLIRVFSIQRDVDGGCSWSGRGKDGTGLDDRVLVDFRRFSNMDDAAGPIDERLQSDIELYIGETESEASLTVARRTMQKAFDSVDLVSVDLHSNSSSTVGLDEDTSGPKRTGSEGSGRPDRSFADSGLVCGATFSNVKSKDALIRTSLTVSSFTPPGLRTSSFNRDERGLRRSPESEDISLDMTSSDSLYSTDDCFCDSSFPDHTGVGRPAFPAAPPSFNPREPSPEDLFDLALESRSDLGGSGSIGSSSFYDAVQCSSPNSSACVPRDDPSPEEAFDLALETLSDVIIDDDSSSVFVIAPRPSAAAVSKRPDLHRPDLHRPDLRPDLHRPTIVCHRTAYDVENTRIKMADVVVHSDSFCDLCGRRRCYSATGGGKGSCCGGQSSSCEATINGDQLMMRGTIDGDLPSDWETRCCGRRRPQETPRLPQEETEELCWSSDPCPSSPETSSTLADYSTDDCAGGESEEEEEEDEEDSSVTDCDAIDPSSSIRTDFFLRLLRRGKTDLEQVSCGRTREKLRRRMEEESLLDQIQICSIEDLMTDSDLERDSWNLNARGVTTTGLELPFNDNSPILSLFRNIQGRMDGRADESTSDQEVGPDVTPAVVVGPIQPLSPPISQSMRTDVQYARKSKIPKLPAGSRTTVPPVRISW